MISSALIGCGRIGFLLEEDPLRRKPCTHLGGMTAAKIHIAAASDPDAERRALFSKRAGIPESAVFYDYRDMLRSRVFDIVTIAVPTPLHSKVTIHAAESGAKVIICEKPIAHTIPEAKRMIAACRKNGVHLIINHERRFDSRYRKVKELLDSGAIGRIVSIRGTIPARGLSHVWDESLGGGPLLHDGTHLIDIISFYAGNIVRVDGRIRKQNKHGFEDYACAILETEQGILAFVEVGGSTAYFGFSVDIAGDTGRIEIGNGFARLYKPGKSRYYKGFMDLVEHPFPKCSDINCFTRLYREAVLTLKGTDSVSSGADGLHALRVIHGIYQSAYKKRPTVLPDSINIKKYLRYNICYRRVSLFKAETHDANYSTKH
jgi:predicted dehydrogenase